jgi:F-type H+-transporting ATPase subunit b
MQARRFSPPIFRIFLLAMLVAAGLATPTLVTAQTTAPAAQPALNSTARPEAAKPEEGQKAEADSNDVYLHAPIVRTMARMLHLDVEITARIFEGINFAIIVLAVGFLLVRWLPKTLRNRTAKVSTDIESARKVSEDANARLSAIEAKLSGLDGEIAQIRAQVEVESREDEARIKSTIKDESASAAQARRSLRNFAADLAIEQAVEQLAITPETDRALIAEFLGDSAVKTTAKEGRK